MEFLYLNFYVCFRLQFLDVETNPCPRRPVPAVGRLLCSNVWSLARNPWPWHHLSMTYCCPQRLWSQICVTCQSCWFPDLVTLFCCAGAGCLRPRDGSIHYRWIWSILPTQVWVCFWKMLILMVCGVRQNLYEFNFYQNPDQDDQIFEFTNINGCRAGWGCACLSPISGWFEWPSSGVTGFYTHKLSWCYSFWLRDCIFLRSAGCRPDPCTRWNTWPPDEWGSWPSMGCLCSTHR